MAIIGNIALSNVIKISTTPLTYQIWLNVVATSDFPINRQRIFLNSVLEDDLSISTTPPIYNYGTIAVPEIVGVAATTTGHHNIDIELTNTNSETVTWSLTLYLDTVSPTVHQFDLNSVSLSAGVFTVDFNINLEDDAGISRIAIRRLDDGSNDVDDPQPVGLTNITDVKSIIVPNSPPIPNNTTLNFELDVYDYSGNKTTTAPYPVSFVSIQPNITDFKITSITQTSTDYIINADITAAYGTFQDITAFSCNFMNTTPVWQPYFATGGSTVISAQVIIPKTTPVNTYQLTAHVKDNFNNTSAIKICLFTLDALAPIGDINMDYAEKIGTYPSEFYYANLHFTASDSGNVTHYSHSTIGPSDLVNHWSAVIPTTNLSHYMTYNLGQSGSTVMYVQYRDFSGNESPVYSELMSVDTIAPDASFSFVQGEVRGDGDYDAHFDLVASDNDKLKFIRLYGVNSVTNTFIPGHSNTEVQITEVGTLIERRSLIIPASEAEDPIDFYFQVRDRYGNESPLRHEQVQFDKNAPNINSISYTDVTKFATEYRIHAEFEADDNYGITAYRFDFGNDLTISPWIATSKTTNLTKEIYLDVQVPTDLNVSKPFSVQVRDAFGNESNIVNTVVRVNDVPPSGSIAFSGSALAPTEYLLNFDLAGVDPDPTDNVHWYSLVADDVLITDWKKFTTPSNSVSETVVLPMPRTSSGRHDFYLKLADKYKNESPVYTMQVDLDAITVVGSISLNSVSNVASSYTANVLLDALDNNYIHSYLIRDSESGNVWAEHNILPPVQAFTEHVDIPIGTTAGPRSVDVQYKDAFGNLSDVYSLNFDLDTISPTAVTYFSGLTTNTTHRFFHYDLNITDNHELFSYKFWDNTVSEPADWTNIPRTDVVSVSETFTLPNVVINPTFFWKVKDFFGNEASGSDTRFITSQPPSSTLSLNSIAYSIGSINVGVDYNITAAGGSQVDKFDIIVNSGLHTETVDVYPNAATVTGTYYYDYPIGTAFSNITIHPYSDYGFKNTTPVSNTTLFDNIKPTIANAIFEGNYGLGNDFVLQIHVEGSDSASGIRKIILEDPAGHIANVEQSMSLTHMIDETFEFSIPGTYPINSISPTIYLEDLLGNLSTGNNIPSVHLDSTGPTISNVVINHNQTYVSPIYTSPAIGANTNMINVSFDAHDYSDITHYNYAPIFNVPFSSSWTSVPAGQKSINISETIDLDALGFSSGTLGGFYIQTRDRFGRESYAGVGFEYDKTPPVSSLTFAGYIEREMIGSVDHFVVPYLFSYSSDYATVLYKNENTPIGGINSNIIQTALPYEEVANTYTESFKIPVADYGPTKVNVSVIDRFEQQSSNSDFTVILENNPPVINSVKINNGATYTNDKNVLVRIDFADDTGATEYLISNTQHLQWDDPNWAVIPFGPHTAKAESFSVDLEAIGFTEGVCNVYSYIKDFCQNTANTRQVIVYDTIAPTAYGLTVNSWTRTATTYDINLDVYAYDETSGLDTYYISQNKNETVYTPVPGRPVIGSLASNTLFQKTEQVSVRDVGKKWFYFSATDMAGNISAQANTYFYIDAVAPVAGTFNPSPDSTKYYLKEDANNFAYAISDDYKLASAGYQIDGQNVIPFKNYVMNEKTDSGIFSANFTTLADSSSLVDGEHTIFLIVRDSYDNTVRIPYEFYYDKTPPTLSLSIKEIQPRTTIPSTTFDVEFLIQADDEAALDYYEIYDNGTLVATVPATNKSIRVSPTIEVNLTSLVPPSGLDVQLVFLEDDVLSSRREVYALVKGFSSGDETKVKNIVSSITGANPSSFGTLLMPETNINNLNLNSAIPTLQAAIGINPTAKFLLGSYSILRLERELYSAGFEPPDSELTAFMRAEAAASRYEMQEDTTPSSSYAQYTRVIFSDRNANQNASADVEIHDFEVRVYDKAGNMTTQTVRQHFHDGSGLSISNFQVDSSGSISRTYFTSENFDADLESKVNLTHEALTIHSSIDFNSSLWVAMTNAKSITYHANYPLSDFALSSIHDDLYLHVKDENGHVVTSSVNISMIVNEPVVSNINSPITLKREGNYYVGELTISITDSDSMIEAFAIGFSKDPDNYKSMPLTNNATIVQNFKVPANEISGSKTLYVRLRDENGLESANYRVSIRILDFKFEKFEIETNEFLFGSTNSVKVLFDIDSNPLDLKYGFSVDDSNEPAIWNTISSVIPNSISEFELSFNLDVIPYANGVHELYVWLKSKEGEKEFRKVSFVSEANSTAPYGTLFLKKSKNDGKTKKLWLEANIFDDGVGVAQVSLVDNVNPVSFENINIIQNKKFTKLFEYDALANTTNTFNLILVDAIGNTSPIISTTVDLSSVY